MLSTNQQPVQIQSAPYQPTVYVVPMATAGSRWEKFAAKTSNSLGIAQIILGSLIIVFSIASIVYHDSTALRGLSVVCGILAIIGGGLGIGASKHQTTCLIVSSMILSILAAVMAGFVILIISLSLAKTGYYIIFDYETVLALRCITMIIAFLEFVCGIWASTLVCKVTCCNSQAAISYQAMYQSETAPPVLMVQAGTVPAANQNLPVQMEAPPHYYPPVTTTASPSGVTVTNQKF